MKASVAVVKSANNSAPAKGEALVREEQRHPKGARLLDIAREALHARRLLQLLLPGSPELRVSEAALLQGAELPVDPVGLLELRLPDHSGYLCLDLLQNFLSLFRQTPESGPGRQIRHHGDLEETRMRKNGQLRDKGAEDELLYVEVRPACTHERIAC